MSSTLETLQKQIASGEDLSSIVRTMKALAATSVRQYEKAAESLDDYYHTVELGLSVTLSTPADTGAAPAFDPRLPALFLVFGSDHGLAGRFNEQIVSYALEGYRAEKEEKDSAGQQAGEAGSKGSGAQDNLLAEAIYIGIGEQVISRLKAAKIKTVHNFHMPSSISAITPFIQQLLETIEDHRSRQGTERVMLFYNRPVTGGFNSQAGTLLPVDFAHLRKTRLKWQSRSLPTYTMPTGRLLSALLRQYFFVSLYRSCALSLAAENTSRLAAMQAAEKNINERLDQLKTVYQQERQAAITEELLDIISGFRAVRGSLNSN